jgi:hypothetical protein
VGEASLISVITPTARIGGLQVVEQALRRQTHDDFEWIIGCPYKPSNLTLPFTWVPDPERDKDDVWVLNKVYNAMIRAARGDLLVSIQDFTFFDADALEKFQTHFEQEPKTLVTGVGNKYIEVYPVLGECVWQDPRINTNHGTYYPCYFNDIEWNFCAVPTAAMKAIGGFDESLDRYYGMDGYGVVDRLNLQGDWDFKIDQTIKSYSLPHGRPKDWDERNALGVVYHKKRQEYISNPVLNYL